MSEYEDKLLQTAFTFRLRRHITLLRGLIQSPERDHRKYGICTHQIAVTAEDLHQLCGEGGCDREHQRTHARAFSHYIVTLLIIQRHCRQDCHLRHRISRHDHAIEHVSDAYINTFRHRAPLNESRIAEQQEHIYQQEYRCKSKPGAVTSPSGIQRITDHAHHRVIDRIPQCTDQQDNRQLCRRNSDLLLYIQGKIGSDRRRDRHCAAVYGCCMKPDKRLAESFLFRLITHC